MLLLYLNWDCPLFWIYCKIRNKRQINLLEMVFLNYTRQSLKRICEADEIFYKNTSDLQPWIQHGSQFTGAADLVVYANSWCAAWCQLHGNQYISSFYIRQSHQTRRGWSICVKWTEQEFNCDFHLYKKRCVGSSFLETFTNRHTPVTINKGKSKLLFSLV